MKQTSNQNSHKMLNYRLINATKPFAKYVSVNSRPVLPSETRNAPSGYCSCHCSLCSPSVRIQGKLSGEITLTVQKKCTPSHPNLHAQSYLECQIGSFKVIEDD